jgi:hypothetical protein
VFYPFQKKALLSLSSSSITHCGSLIQDIRYVGKVIKTDLVSVNLHPRVIKSSEKPILSSTEEMYGRKTSFGNFESESGSPR